MYGSVALYRVSGLRLERIRSFYIQLGLCKIFCEKRSPYLMQMDYQPDQYITIKNYKTMFQFG